MGYSAENAPVWHCLWSYFFYPPLVLSTTLLYPFAASYDELLMWLSFVCIHSTQMELLFDVGLFGPFWETATYLCNVKVLWLDTETVSAIV
jgi:hypothetical protein